MPRTTRRRSAPDGSGPSLSTRLTRGTSSTPAMVNRSALNASGGNRPRAALVTLKLIPQMRHTRSMPRSAEDGEDGEGGEDGEEVRDEAPSDGLVTPGTVTPHASPPQPPPGAPRLLRLLRPLRLYILPMPQSRLPHLPIPPPLA